MIKPATLYILSAAVIGLLTPAVVQVSQNPVFLVMFEPGHYEIKNDDPGIRNLLAYQTVSRATRSTHGRVVIVGYASKDSDSGNLVELSRLRAIAVADRLVEEGFPKAWIAVDWKGDWEREDAINNIDPRHNRRVEIWPIFWNPNESNSPPQF